MRRKLIVLVTAFTFFQCQSDPIPMAEEEIKKTDIAFSSYSEKHGLNAAFIKYADTSGVLLKPDQLPIKGIDAIKKYYEKVDDAEVILTWLPEFVEVASSGDLGYTYGFWKLTNKKDSTTGKGTYLSIWKKQKDGSWKYVLDTGNSGLGEDAH